MEETIYGLTLGSPTNLKLTTYPLGFVPQPNLPDFIVRIKDEELEP